MAWRLLGFDRCDVHWNNIVISRGDCHRSPCGQQQAPTYRLKEFNSAGSTFCATQTTGNTAIASGLTKGAEYTCTITTATDASVAGWILVVTKGGLSSQPLTTSAMRASVSSSARRYASGWSRRHASRFAMRLRSEHPEGMMSGMTSTKIAVSLPSELVAQAKRAVADGRSPSVSAYVARALEEQAKLDDLALLLEEMLAESGGPLTAAERKAADLALGR